MGTEISDTPSASGVKYPTKTTRRLDKINQEMYNLATAAFTGKIHYIKARFEIQKLVDERECLWAGVEE